MKNVIENYAKLSDEPLDLWLEKEDLEIEISGYEPDGFRAFLLFKGGKIADGGYYVFDRIEIPIIDNDITENGIKKAMRNMRFSKAEPFKEIIEFKRWFKSVIVERVNYKYTEVRAPNFNVNNSL
jgi:hypothetical protein